MRLVQITVVRMSGGLQHTRCARRRLPRGGPRRGARPPGSADRVDYSGTIGSTRCSPDGSHADASPGPWPTAATDGCWGLSTPCVHRDPDARGVRPRRRPPGCAGATRRRPASVPPGSTVAVAAACSGTRRRAAARDAPGCRAAAGLPVVFLGHVADRARLSQFRASVDLAAVPGPIETFGFAAHEALASATPVVSRRRGALPELVDDVCGAPAYGHPGAFATSALDLLDRGHGQRVAAGAGAERFT